MCATWRDSLNTYSQLIRWSPLQWIIVALVKPLNVVAIEALVTDLHPGTQRAHGRKFLDGKPDRLRCGRKAAIAQRLSWPARALAHEQLGGYAVVECYSLAVGRFCVHVEFYHGNPAERIVWTPRGPMSPSGRARTGEGRKRAKDRGARFGRPQKLNAHQRQEALARREAGETLMDIARSYGVSHPTTMRL